MTDSFAIGSRFVSREGYTYEIIDSYLNGNYLVMEQRGRRRPVQKSIPAWAITNNVRGGYWHRV